MTVSKCCGAKIKERIQTYGKGVKVCSLCGKPCKAVEEKPQTFLEVTVDTFKTAYEAIENRENAVTPPADRLLHKNVRSFIQEFMRQK